MQIHVKHDIFRLDISMNDVVCVQMPYRGQNLPDDSLTLGFGYLCLIRQEFKELTAVALGHHDKKFVLAFHDLREAQHMVTGGDAVHLGHDGAPVSLSHPVVLLCPNLHHHFGSIHLSASHQNTALAASAVDLFLKVIRVVDRFAGLQRAKDLINLLGQRFGWLHRRRFDGTEPFPHGTHLVAHRGFLLCLWWLLQLRRLIRQALHGIRWGGWTSLLLVAHRRVC
mmetsp:Transcript_83350/g.131924  ORF Transcript_83350/g.131924 Transcript_83350/m.131924 type:complete len:225 (-) Transcript_83350:353-1027(-)